MTVEETWEDPGPAKRTIVSRLAEFGFWVVAPIGVAMIAAILALIFGAPPGRVIGVFAFLAAAAGAYFIWRPSERFKVRKARGAGLIWTGLFASLIAIAASAPASGPSSPSAPRTEVAATAPLTDEQREAQNAARAAAAAEQAARREEATRNAAEQRRVEYVERLEREMSETSAQTFLRSTETTEQIIVAAAVFSALASLYEDGRSLGLSPDQERVRQRFKARVIEWQAAALPELRNRFGPAMARRVWRDNMEVRTIGTGYRTIDLSWGGFASNANIEDFHTTARANFEALRFRRAQYRWYPGADRFQYYTMDGPGDRELMVTRGGRWIAVAD